MNNEDGMTNPAHDHHPHENDDLHPVEGFLRDLQGGFAAPDDRGAHGMNRRRFLAISAAMGAFALAGCSRPEKRIVPYVIAPENHVDGVAEWYATTIPMGGAAVGVMVKSFEGRPIKIDGNPRHPRSYGGTEKWAQASVLSLYDPDRLATPLIAGAAADWNTVDARMAETLKRAQAARGGVRILLDPHCSPTLAGVLQSFTALFDDARVVHWSPLGPARTAATALRVFGDRVLPTVIFARTRVFLAIEDDFLALNPYSETLIHDFTAARRVEKPGDTMMRCYAVESALTLTGANCDVRLRVRPSDIAPFLVGLIKEIARARGRNIGEIAALPSTDVAALPGGAALVADLLANPSAARAGYQQPDAVHALIHALNEVLGAHANGAVIYNEPQFPLAGDSDAIVALRDEMKAGRVDTLIIASANPVHATPAGLDFAGAMKSVPNTFALAEYHDETAALCAMVGNEAHYLESWGDAEAMTGVYGVVQPLIAPLHGGRTLGEALLAWMARMGAAPAGAWYDRIRDTWRGLHAASGSPLGFDAFWEGVLVEGCCRVHPAAPVAVTASFDAAARIAREAPSPGAGAFDLVILPSAQLYDGRWANNAWLQELPDPVTKLTWDNAALMSRATAERLGCDSGDMVELAAGGVRRTLPALVQPGMADGAIVATLGYGRTRCGNVGAGVGVDVFPLCNVDPRTQFIVRVDARRTGAHRQLAVTQGHDRMENRAIALDGTLDEFNADPAFVAHAQHLPRLESVFTEHEYPGHYWGMSVDLNACVGCNACVIACVAENNIAVVGVDQVRRGRHMYWMRIDRYYSGPDEDPVMHFQPVLCQHCKNAPCENVCPVGATTHSPEGLNEQAYNRCVGTRYCSNNCPYKVRRFNFYNYNTNISDSLALGKNPDVTIRWRGVMEKCTFCVQRINAGKHHARQEGRERVVDGEIRTACMEACPAKAIVFGDMHDPASRVARNVDSPRRYRLLEELNTKPSVNYLVKLRNPGRGGRA